MCSVEHYYYYCGVLRPVVFCMCITKVCLELNVRPSIFTFFSVLSVLFIVSLSFVECSAGCGCRVNSIVFVFEELRIRLFCLIQLNMSCRYAKT